MTRLPELLDYTRKAIDGIEDAINYHFIRTKDVPLDEYGNLIRGLKENNKIEITMLPIIIDVKKKIKPLANFVIYDFEPIVHELNNNQP